MKRFGFVTNVLVIVSYIDKYGIRRTERNTYVDPCEKSKDEFLKDGIECCCTFLREEKCAEYITGVKAIYLGRRSFR